MSTTLVVTLCAVIVAATGTLLSVIIFVARQVVANITSVTNGLRAEIKATSEGLRVELHALRGDIKDLKTVIDKIETRQWEHAKDIERLKAVNNTGVRA